MKTLPKLIALILAGLLWLPSAWQAGASGRQASGGAAETAPHSRPSAAGTDTVASPRPVDPGEIPDDFDDLNLDEMPEFLRILEEEPAPPDPEVWLDTAIVNRQARLAERRYVELTEDDYREVAEELGVDVAAIKAVVEIEAGPKQEGFWAPGKPLINFDLSMYRKFAPRHGVSIKKAQKSSPVIFSRPDVRRYGSYQAAQQARLDAAAAIDLPSAFKSTFWGMFQIGGFNWKKCGAESVEDFVSRMSRSERDQLELFAAFIRNNGMLQAIRDKNWLRFALIYNGPKARSRGYHTRLAKAYKRFSAKK